jgi:hypothetical protein
MFNLGVEEHVHVLQPPYPGGPPSGVADVGAVEYSEAHQDVPGPRQGVVNYEFGVSSLDGLETP